jgi:hypothetical protein
MSRLLTPVVAAVSLGILIDIILVTIIVSDSGLIEVARRES